MWNRAYQHHNYRRRSFRILLQDTICYKSIYYYLLKETVSSHIQYASSVPKSFEWLNDDLCDVNESEKKNYKYYCITNPILNEKLREKTSSKLFQNVIQRGYLKVADITWLNICNISVPKIIYNFCKVDILCKCPCNVLTYSWLRVETGGHSLESPFMKDLWINITWSVAYNKNFNTEILNAFIWSFMNTLFKICSK